MDHTLEQVMVLFGVLHLVVLSKDGGGQIRDLSHCESYHFVIIVFILIFSCYLQKVQVIYKNQHLFVLILTQNSYWILILFFLEPN